MANQEIKWTDEEFEGLGIVQLDSVDPTNTESLILKPPPEFLPPEKLTLKSSFQVDTALVLTRLKKCLWPMNTSNFFDDSVPDLYSPFWLVTTLILTISIAASMISTSISVIASSALLFYTTAMSVPGILYCLLSNHGSSIDYYTLLSIYGYSFIHFNLAGLLSLINYWPVRLIAWTTAGFLSLLFLKNTLEQEIIKTLPGKSLTAAGILVLGHLLIILSSNFYFLSSNV